MCGEVAAESAEDAERGAQAVRDTLSAMTAIAERVSIVGEIAQRTNLLSLNASIEATAELVRMVADTSQEQSGNVGQINRAMTQVEQVTQRNAASAEALTATAAALSGQAEAPQRQVSFFQVAAARVPERA